MQFLASRSASVSVPEILPLPIFQTSPGPAPSNAFLSANGQWPVAFLPEAQKYVVGDLGSSDIQRSNQDNAG